MLGRETALEAVRNTIQNTYGDATQTALDHECARKIIDALTDCGWVGPIEVALLMHGVQSRMEDGIVQVTIPDQQVLTVEVGKVTFRRWRNPHLLGTTIECRIEP